MKSICTAMIAMFWFASAWGQKVLLIMDPVLRPHYDAANYESNLYYVRGTIDAKDNARRTVTEIAERSNSAYVINVEDDSLLLYSYDPRGIFGDDRNHKDSMTACFLFRHIQSFPGDTIVISGLAFDPYRGKRVCKITYSWKESADSMYRTKPIHIKPSARKSFIKTLSYPRLKINGLDFSQRIELVRQTAIGNAFLCNSEKHFSYYYEYEDLLLRFVVDLTVKN